MLPPLIEKKLQDLSTRHAELEKQLSDPALLSNQSLYRSVSRECGGLGKIVSSYQQYVKNAKELADNEELSRADDDPELGELAREEVTRLKPLVSQQAQDLTDRVLVEDKHADRNVIVEIRAGTGGDEAALFAADLFRM